MSFEYNFLIANSPLSLVRYNLEDVLELILHEESAQMVS